MFRKRGAPVFLELLTGGAKPPGIRAPKPPAPPPERPAPLFQPAPASKTVAALESKPTPELPLPAPLPASLIEERGGELLGGTLGLSPKTWVYLAGIGVLVLAVWVIAYTAGKHSGKEEGERDKGRLASIYADGAVPDPLDSTKKPADRPNPPSPNPNGAPSKPTPPAPAPSPAVTTLEKGSNYLVVATLMKRDAEEATAYLAAKGIQTALVSPGGKVIDLSAPDANNVQWMVVVLKGYAAADFRKLDSERMALVNQVQSLGRKWKSENKKAPTDFSQVFWWKFKGA